MSISKLVIATLASISLGIATTHASTVTDKFIFTDQSDIVVASGYFSFDSAATGTINYADLSAFSISLVGQSYDLAYVNSLNPALDYVYFGFDISANSFVPASVSGSYGDYRFILAGSNVDTDGFLFSPLAFQGGPNADGVFTEYRTFTDLTAEAFSISRAIPEPSTWTMLILGFLGLAGLACRRKGGFSFFTV